MRTTPLLLLSLLVTLAAAAVNACGKAEAPAPASPTAAAPASRSGESGGERAAGNTKEQAPAPTSPRKIIRNGELQVVVKAYAPARREIEELVRRAGGYLSSTQINHSMGEVSSATIVLRVPAGSFDGIHAAISRLGTVVREATSSRDITEEYFDLRARLTNARKLESRILELLGKAAKVSDVLEVERELARIRGEIERFEGKLRLFDSLVDLSTLTVTLNIQEKYVPPQPPSLGGDLRRVLGDSWEALCAFGRGLLVAAVALLPWLLPLGLCAWLLLRTYRRSRARNLARKASLAATRPAAPAAQVPVPAAQVPVPAEQQRPPTDERK